MRLELNQAFRDPRRHSTHAIHGDHAFTQIMRMKTALLLREIRIVDHSPRAMRVRCVTGSVYLARSPPQFVDGSVYRIPATAARATLVNLRVLRKLCTSPLPRLLRAVLWWQTHNGELKPAWPIPRLNAPERRA